MAHHADLVFSIALRATRHAADAEDLAQDAFVRAHRALRTYPTERIAALRLRGWLAVIVRNLARDRARRRPPAEAPLDGVADWLADSAPGPEHMAARHEGELAWQARLATLPPAYREAVALRHIDGLSYPELAEVLGRPVGSVKSDVHRGVRLLRDAWARDELVGAAQGTKVKS